MVMWYTVFEAQLAIIMMLTLPVWIYPFLDAIILVRRHLVFPIYPQAICHHIYASTIYTQGNIFELYRRGNDSEGQQRKGPVTIASTSVKCLESRAAWGPSVAGGATAGGGLGRGSAYVSIVCVVCGKKKGHVSNRMYVCICLCMFM